MLHFSNYEQINPSLTTAECFEAKLGTLLTAVNTNSSNLLQPARSISIDEIMVKFMAGVYCVSIAKRSPTNMA